MKKYLILLTVGSLLWQINCQAETFYSDYYLTKGEVNEQCLISDTLKCEEIIKYHNVTWLREDLGYYVIGNNPHDTYYDESNYHAEVYNSLNFSQDSFQQQIYLSSPVSVKARYLRFNTDALSIKVFNQEQELTIITSSENGYLTIDLGSEQQLNKLRIVLIFNTPEVVEVTLVISIATKDDYVDYPFSLLANSLTENNLLFANSDYFIAHAALTKLFSSNELGKLKSYRYFINEKREYLFYQLIKEPTNEYSIEPLPGYEHDLNAYQVTYNYYARDKIVVTDEIISREDPLIIYSSVPVEQIKLSSNLDLFTNGEYKVSFYINENFSFTKIVKVNIPVITTKPNQKTTTVKTEKTTKPPKTTTIKTTKQNNPNVKDKNAYPLGVFIAIIILSIFLFNRKKIF